MRVPAEEQNVITTRKPPESIEVAVACADEVRAVAGKLNLPYSAVRDVVAGFAADVLDRKVRGQVAKIFAAHVNGVLPLQTAPITFAADEGDAR